MLIIVGRSNRSQLRPESCRSGAAAAETSQRLLKDRDSQALRSSRSFFESRYRSRCARANASRVRNDVVTIALLVEHRFPSPFPAPYGRDAQSPFGVRAPLSNFLGRGSLKRHRSCATSRWALPIRTSFETSVHLPIRV